MNVLLDSCVWFWMIYDTPKLSPFVRESIENDEWRLFISPISFWEFAVKRAKDPSLPSHQDLVHMAGIHDFQILPFTQRDITPLEKLPPIHKDPFDRLMICQAISNGCVLVTPDQHIQNYPIRTAWKEV